MEIFSEKRTGPKVEPPFRYLVYCFEEWHRTNLAKKLRKHGVKTRPLPETTKEMETLAPSLHESAQEPLIVLLATYKQPRPQDVPVDVIVHLEPLDQQKDYIECLSVAIKYCADNDIPVTVFTLAINYSDKPDFVALEYIPARHMEDSSSSSH